MILNLYTWKECINVILIIVNLRSIRNKKILKIFYYLKILVYRKTKCWRNKWKNKKKKKSSKKNQVMNRVKKKIGQLCGTDYWESEKLGHILFVVCIRISYECRVHPILYRGRFSFFPFFVCLKLFYIEYEIIKFI